MKEKLSDFYGGYATEEETVRMIGETYKSTGYVMDPHTAVAAWVSRAYREKNGDDKKMLVVSTASPYKFSRSVMTALDAFGGKASRPVKPWPMEVWMSFPWLMRWKRLPGWKCQTRSRKSAARKSCTRGSATRAGWRRR